MAGKRSIRLIIADDHVVVREGLIAILTRIGISVLAQAGGWYAAIRKISPEVRIVLISAFDLEEDIYGVIRAGTSGFLAHNCVPREIESCLCTVLEGKMWLPPDPASRLFARIHAPQLTRCQSQVLSLIAEGRTNKEVASAMKITEGTVKIHVNHIFKKLGVAGRTAAITTALRLGLIRLSELPDVPRKQDARLPENLAAVEPRRLELQSSHGPARRHRIERPRQRVKSMESNY